MPGDGILIECVVVFAPYGPFEVDENASFLPAASCDVGARKLNGNEEGAWRRLSSLAFSPGEQA